MDYKDINEKLKQLKIEDFIWIIYIGIIFMSWYANSLERKYFIYNDIKSKEKYPKVEKLALVSTIKNNTYEGMKKVILAYKYYDKKDKLKCLNELDVDLKMLKVLIRISKKRKYISKRNYEAWSKKINNIGNMLGGWIMSCLKQ